MEDFASILQRDYGLKPQGKSAPMSSTKTSGPSPFSSSSSASTMPTSMYRTSSAPKTKDGSNHDRRSANPILGESLDEDFFFGSANGMNGTRNTYGSAPSNAPPTYDDVFGGPPKYAASSYSTMPSASSQQSASTQSYDDIFRMPLKTSASASSASNKGSSLPVFDPPLYDDDIFGGVPGIRSTTVAYDDVFSGGSTVGTGPNVLEDLLGVSESRDRSSTSKEPVLDESVPTAGSKDFDDLLPGFGGTEPVKPRSDEAEEFSENSLNGKKKSSFSMHPSDPFDVLQDENPFNVPEPVVQPSGPPFSDLEDIKGTTAYAYYNQDTNVENPFSAPQTAAQPSVPPFSDLEESAKGTTLPSYDYYRQNSSTDHNGSESGSPPVFKTSSLHESHYPDPPFNAVDEQPSTKNQTNSNGVSESVRHSSSPKIPKRTESPSFLGSARQAWQVQDEVVEPVLTSKVPESRQSDEYWISVDEVKLVTEPTTGPPPSRRPPLPGQRSSGLNRKIAGFNLDSSIKESSSRHESPQSNRFSKGASESSNIGTTDKSSNPFDDFEQFVSGVSRARKETKMDMSAPTLDEEMIENSTAASASTIAMKEAVERARSKALEREKDKDSGSKADEAQVYSKDTKEDEEEEASEAEERLKAQEREEKEKEKKAIREKEERERRRREREKEREKDRIALERAAVDRANKEARERAAAEVRQRLAAERAAAERAAVERVTAEARERAAAEARERAAAEAKEKAERAAVERAAAEAKERAERAAAERAVAEARERAAAEARERAANEAKVRAAAEACERAAAEAREKAERAAAERAAAEARERVAAERAASEARARAERAFVDR